MQPLLPPTTILWTLTAWRCQVDPRNQMRLYHGDHLVAEHRATLPEHVPAYADVWRGAILEIMNPDWNDDDGGTSPDGSVEHAAGR